MKNLLLFTVLSFYSIAFYPQNWQQVGEDIISVGIDDRSGASVSMSDDGLTMAIGSPFNKDNGRLAGHVRVLTFDGTSWVLKGNLIEGDSSEMGFGISVSLSADANRIAVFAAHGKVRIYEWNGTSWQQIGNSIDKETLSIVTGSVAISGNGTVVGVGDLGNTTNGVNAGEVRLYTLIGNSWQQKGSSITGTAYGVTGTALSISDDGNCFATNLHKEKDIQAYYWDRTDWALKGDIMNEFRATAVILSSDGNTMAIAGYNGLGETDQFAFAQVYQWNGTSWNQNGNPIQADKGGGIPGYSLSLSKNGKVMALGVPNNYTYIGETRVFVQNGANWEQKGETLFGEFLEFFGQSVSLNASGNILGIEIPKFIHTQDTGKMDKSVVFRNDAVLDVPEISALEFTVFPNPTNGNFTIGFGKEYIDVGLQIYNMLGQNISSEKFVSAKSITKEIIAPAGIYFVNVSTKEGRSKTLKIIKN